MDDLVYLPEPAPFGTDRNAHPYLFAMPTDIQSILAMYPSLHVTSITPLAGAGGFSGALFWRLQTDSGSYCLRHWPVEHPNQSHLQWIHAVLRHVYRAGQDYVPLPIPNRAGQTVTEFGGHLWEMSPWMSGRADFRETARTELRKIKLSNAMTSLALWHKSAAGFQPSECRPAAPGLVTRWKRYDSLCQGGIDDLRRSVVEYRGPLPTSITSIAKKLMDEFSRSANFAEDLHTARQIPVTLQPCIRDIWHDHVLYTGERVSGFVDFGAMRMEAIAGDVARLLGSLAVDDEQLWEIGLQSYHSANPPPDQAAMDAHRHLIRTWDAANVLLTGLQWVQWLFVDGRRFTDRKAVQQRMWESWQRLQYRNRS